VGTKSREIERQIKHTTEEEEEIHFVQSKAKPPKLTTPTPTTGYTKNEGGAKIGKGGMILGWSASL